jgi:hypothetical protein
MLAAGPDCHLTPDGMRQTTLVFLTADALRSFAMRSPVSRGRTPATRGLILSATDREHRSLWLVGGQLSFW